jgi:hypothetical protein
LEPMRLCILGCKTGHFWKHDETCSLCSCQFGLSRCWFWMILGATDWNTWRDSEPALLKVVCCVIRHTNHTNKKVQKNNISIARIQNSETQQIKQINEASLGISDLHRYRSHSLPFPQPPACFGPCSRTRSTQLANARIARLAGHCYSWWY